MAVDTERLVSVDKAAEHPALELFNLEHISKALRASSWSVNAEMAILTRIAQDRKVNARVSMEAADRIRQIVKESAILSGYIRRLSVSKEHLIDESGRTITSTRISSDQFLAAADTEGASTLDKLEAGLEISAKQPQLNAERRTLRLIPAANADGETNGNLRSPKSTNGGDE